MAHEPDQRAPFLVRAGWALVRVLVGFFLGNLGIGLPDGALRPRPPAPPDAPKDPDITEIHRRVMTGQRVSEAEYDAICGVRWPAEPTVRDYVPPGDPALWPDGREKAGEPDPAEVARRLRNRTRRWVIALFVVVGGLGALALEFAGLYQQHPPLPRVLSRCAGVAPLGAPVVGTPVRVGDDLESSVVAGRVVWAIAGRTDLPGTLVAAVDASPRGPVGRHVSDVDAAAYGGGLLWAARGDRLLTLDPRTGRPVGAPISLGGPVTRLVVGDGSVWTFLHGDEVVRRVDMATRRVQRDFETGGAVWALAAGEGAVWLLDQYDDGARRLDPRTGAIRKITIDALSPDDVVVAAGWVWMLGDGRVVRIDPRTLAQSPPIGVGGSAHALAAAGDAILVEDRGGGVFRIDPRCDRAVGPVVDVGADNVGPVAYGGGTAWIAGSDGVLTPIRFAG